jgi:hypothetical protein
MANDKLVTSGFYPCLFSVFQFAIPYYYLISGYNI